MMVEKYLLRDYYIENWIIILDLDKKGFMSFPFKAIQATISVTSLVFAGRMHSLYMLNPTFMFYGLWKLISNFLPPDVLAKIQILKKNGFGKLLEIISKDQLLEKYGGTMIEQKQTFPMRTTFTPDEKPIMAELDISENNFIPLEDSSLFNEPLISGSGKKQVSKIGNAQSNDWDVI